MSQMAGFDFSVVTPMRRRGFDPEAAEAEDRLQLELARNATWDAGPVPEQNLDIAPENVPVPQLGPDPLVQAADAAMSMEQGAGSMEQGVEPPLPQADEDLPPVVPAVEGFDFSKVTPIQAEARPAEPAGPTEAGGGSGGPALPEGFDFSKVTPIEEQGAGSVEQGAKRRGRTGELDAAMTRAPVTTPEAGDGTDVTFKEGDAPFKFTGKLVVDPSTGPMATDPLRRAPRLVPDGGQIVFDQSSFERFTEGVERAFESGLLPQANYEKIKANEAAIFKVVEDRKKLEAKAQADPRLLAALQGAGKGGAITAGAIGGAKGGAALGLLAGPAAKVASPVLAVAGGITGGIAAGVGYDALYKQLAKHFEEYDNVMQAAELYPQYKANGELAMAAISLGAGGVQGARGLMNTAAGPGGVPAAARQAVAAGAAGAGTGVVAYPIDAAVRGEEITPGGFATAAGVGVLGGGFFINSRLATQKDLLAVSAKIKAGQKLTAAEEQLVKAAEPAMRAAFAEMEAAGGQWRPPGVDAKGRFVSNEMEVRIPQTTVAGFMPASGRATARIPYDVPLRLGAPAMARAEAFRTQPPPARPAETTVPPTETAPAVPRQAPVNVLDPGTTPIPMPGPAVPATMTVGDFLRQEFAARGFDPEDSEATMEIMEAHKAAVREAIDAEQPVSIDALEAYEFDVPYYVRNEETGLATFDAETFKAWSDYITGQDADMAADNAESGVELLDAIAELGGLPSQKAGDRRGAWAGELASLLETAQGSGKGKASDNQKGVLLNKLFRKDAKDIDDLVTGLRGKGFRVETPQQLIDMLDMRLRSGRPVYGYGLQADEPMPAELRGRRPAPGAPRQMDLLGESDVEFTLQGQTDRTSLTPEEMIQRNLEAQRAQDAEKLQADLFGEGNVQDTSPGPAQEAAGGGAQVPPGAVPVGMAAINPPKWVIDRGETSEGRRLIKGFQNFKLGQKWSFGDIVRLVNKATQVEMRRTKTQVSARHPAHYRPDDKVVFTESEQSQINFHEAGHQFRYMLSDRIPDIFTPHEAELLRIINRPGSMASKPPKGVSPQQAKAYLVGEGVAEWMRLLVVEPRAVDGLPLTKTIFEAADRLYPGISRSLRDATRAMFAFEIAPTENRMAIVNNAPQERLTGSALMSAVVTGKEALGNYIASGAPIDRMRVKVFRAVMRQRKEVGLTRRQALEAARAAAKKLEEPINAYNMILQLDAETQLAISGKGASKGLRVVGPDGNFVYFTKWTWNDLRDRVPFKHRALFDQGAWALESYERWKFGGMAYSGMREGITPDDLLAMVKQAKDTIPGFGQLFAEQMNWHHSLLEIREFGQILSAEERRRIQYKRDSYWPLPRTVINERAYGGKAAARISKGVMAARGSTDPTREIDEVTVQRTAETLEAYYWNRFMIVARDRMHEVGRMKNLPWAARQMASNFSTKLNMPVRKVATLNEDEKVRIKNEVIAALAAKMEAVLGFKPEIDPKTVHVAFNFKDLWRPVEPGDIRVFSYFRDGQRVYEQIGDPAMFAIFAEGSRLSPTVKFLKWLFGPMGENWKRMKTQGVGFAIHNVQRDITTQMLLNPDAVGWIPGGAHAMGVWNKFSQKYPQVFQEGLLLSRSQPTESELIYNAKHSALWQFLTQGLYVSNAKNPVVKVLATVLQPSNLMYPAWLLGDVVNYVTGGRKLAQYLEEVGREGAAVSVLRRGGTDEEAMKKYWMVSGQFNERPGVADVSAMVKIIPFGNPNLQATRNSIQALFDPDPARSGTAWARLAMIAGMSSAAAAVRYLMMSDEEKEEERNRTLEDRMAYANVGGIRMAYTYGPEGAVQSFAENAVMDHLLDRKTDGKEAAAMMIKRVFDPEGMLSLLGPQVAAWNETRANWSFFRRKHIVAPWMVNLPASEQYYTTTPEFYRRAGRMLDYSPAKLQYLVQQALGTQVDETIRLMESMDGGRPIQEAADIPFAGRLFVRDPIGFASAPVREANTIEDKLRLLNTRLNAKGYGTLAQADRNGNMIVNRDELASPELRRLHVQLEYLQGLRKGLRMLDDVQAIGKAYTLNRDFANERNVRVLQTELTQSLLIGNQDRIRVLDQAIQLLDEIKPAPPEQQAADYLQRRF